MYSRPCQTSKIYYRSLAGFWICLWGWFWEILSQKGAFRLWTKFQEKFLFQKQSSTVLKNIYVKDFQNILRKSLEVHWLSNYKVRSWFLKNQGMNFYEDSFQAATLLKKWLRYMCFPTKTSPVAASDFCGLVFSSFRFLTSLRVSLSSIFKIIPFKWK